MQVYLKSVYNYFDYVDITTRSNLSRSSYNIETDFQNGIYVLSDIIMESGKKFLFMKEFDVCAEIYFKQEKIRDQISRLINIFELDENRYKENLTRIEYYFYSKMIKHCKQGLTFMNLFENGKQNDAYNFENLCKSQNVSEVIKSSQGQVIIVTENENVLNSYIIDKDGEAYIEESLLSTAMAIDHFDCLKIGTINYDLAYEDIEWTKMGKDKQGNLRQKKSKRVVLNCKGVKWIGNNDFDFLIIGK